MPRWTILRRGLTGDRFPGREGCWNEASVTRQNCASGCRLGMTGQTLQLQMGSGLPRDWGCTGCSTTEPTQCLHICPLVMRAEHSAPFPTWRGTCHRTGGRTFSTPFTCKPTAMSWRTMPTRSGKWTCWYRPWAWSRTIACSIFAAGRDGTVLSSPAGATATFLDWDRSRYLIRLARRRAKASNLDVRFREGDARKCAFGDSAFDCVFMMGNSFGYFDREEDDLSVLTSVKRTLRSHGRLAVDLTDGDWMRSNFEPRSWEWIDQDHFVCRERSLSSDGDRLISREVIVHAEKGVIADQFYAERLYSRARNPRPAEPRRVF